jgi:hypothetical protein
MDANSITVKGQEGRIVWGYHTAARLAAWCIDGHTLTATVQESDTFRVTQQPLTFVVSRPTGSPWVWTVASLQVAGQTLTASLLP